MAADGVLHTLENEQVRIDLFEDSAYGVHLQQIRNKTDDITLTKGSAPLDPVFRLILSRTGNFGDPDPFITLEPPFTPQGGTGQYIHAVTLGTVVEETGVITPRHGADSWGSRDRVTFPFTVDVETPSGENLDLDVEFVTELLDEMPDRFRFQLFFKWTSSLTGPSWSVFWSAPVLLRFAPTSPWYFNAVNGGIVTKAPSVDLAAQFTKDEVFEGQYKSGAFNPAEFYYPGQMTSAVSGWRDSSGNILYTHDDFEMIPRRFRDTMVGSDLLLQPEQIVKGATMPINEFSAGGIWKSGGVSYTRLFEETGQVLGEEIGLDYRRFFLGSPVVRSTLVAKDRDRLTNRDYPLMCLFQGRSENDMTELRRTTAGPKNQRIIQELKYFFPNLEGTKIPFYADGYLEWMTNTDLATDEWLDEVDRAAPYRWQMETDKAKQDNAFVIRGSDRAHPISMLWPRHPAPYDSGGSWDTNRLGGVTGDISVSGGRVRPSGSVYDATNYKQHDDYFRVTTTVSAVSYSSGRGLTVVTPAATLDQTLIGMYTQYNRSPHSAHLHHRGVLRNITRSKWFITERDSSDTDYLAGQLTVIGDRTADIQVGDSIDFWYFGQWDGTRNIPFIGGWDNVGSGNGGDVKRTSLCPIVDDSWTGGSSPGDGRGVWGDFIAKVLTSCFADTTSGEWLSGLLLLGLTDDLICFEENHFTHIDQTTTHYRADPASLTMIRSALADLRTRAIAAQLAAGSFADDSDRLLLMVDRRADWLIGEADGDHQTPLRNNFTQNVGSWGKSPFFETALGDWMLAGMYRGPADGGGHVSTVIGPTLMTSLENSTDRTAAFGAVRQAMVADWLLNRKLVSLDHSYAPGEGWSWGTRDDGRAGHTIFSHPVVGLGEGATVTWGIPHLVARMLTLQDTFSRVNLKGRRLRSLDQVSTVSLAQITTASLDHVIGPTEDGSTRPNIMHSVFQDPSNPRKLYAIFVNDWKSRAGDTFRFKPSYYTSDLPANMGWYKVTKYVFEKATYTTTELGQYQGDKLFALSMDGSEVWVYEFNFESGLTFQYRYDDDSYTSVSIPATKNRARVEDIHGSGERFQYGFSSDLPDEEIELVNLLMRVVILGRSKTS